MRPAGHRLPETSCTGRAPHGLSQPPDMPDRDRSTPYRPPVRHQPSLPRQPPAGVSRPRFRPASLSPPLRAYHEAATAWQPHESLRHRCPVSPNTPSLPDIRTRRTSAEERPALRRACSHYQGAPPTDPPLHRRKAPSHTSRGIPAARKQARARKNSGIFSPQFSPSLLFPAP